MTPSQIKQLEAIVREHGHTAVLEEIANIIRDRHVAHVSRMMALNQGLNVFRRAIKSVKDGAKQALDTALESGNFRIVDTDN